MNFEHIHLFLVLSGTFDWEIVIQTLIMSMRKTTLAPGQLCVLFTWRKVTSARRVTRCCTTGNPPLEVSPRQRKTHVSSYRRQTVHRGKVVPGVSELPRCKELSRDHVNRPLITMLRLVKNTKFLTAVHHVTDIIKNARTIFETSDTRLLDAQSRG